MLLFMARKQTTVHGIAGLTPIAPDWFKVVDSGLEVKYRLRLEDEPGVILTPRLELHRSHLPLLPGWSGCRPRQSWTAAPPQPLNEEWWSELRPYQLEAAGIMRTRRGSLLTDDLGAGKSRTSLAAADYPVLIFCPKSAVVVWEDEAAYAGLRFFTLSKRVADTKVFEEEHDVWILPWSVAGSWAGFFGSHGMGPRALTKIGDEIHEIQKGQTHAAKAWKLVDAPRSIGLTATPIRNRLRSLWSLLDGVQPKAWGNHYDFRRRYCAGTQGEYGFVDGEPSHEDLTRLRRRLEACIIKRTREDLGLTIPPLKRRVHTVWLPNRKKLELLQESCRAVFDSGQFRKQESLSGQHLTQLTGLRQELGMIKAQAALPLIEELTETWRRSIVWIWHNEVADYLLQRIPLECRFKAVSITGATLDKRRKAIIREWRDADPRPEVPEVLIASIGACSSAVAFLSTGLSIFVEQDWAPLQMIQAEKRTHRPFQKCPECLAVYLTTGEGTIDHQITETLIEKAEESEALLGEDGQVDQMRVLLGLDRVESDRDFMARVAERIKR